MKRQKKVFVVFTADLRRMYFFSSFVIPTFFLPFFDFFPLEIVDEKIFELCWSVSNFVFNFATIFFFLGFCSTSIFLLLKEKRMPEADKLGKNWETDLRVEMKCLSEDQTNRYVSIWAIWLALTKHKKQPQLWIYNFWFCAAFGSFLNTPLATPYGLFFTC